MRQPHYYVLETRHHTKGGKWNPLQHSEQPTHDAAALEMLRAGESRASRAGSEAQPAGAAPASVSVSAVSRHHHFTRHKMDV